MVKRPSFFFFLITRKSECDHLSQVFISDRYSHHKIHTHTIKKAKDYTVHEELILLSTRCVLSMPGLRSICYI